MKFTILLIGALAGTLLPCPGRQTFRAPLGDDGSLVEVTSVFETLPPTGYAPVHVKLVNNTLGAQSISVRNSSRTSSGYGGGLELESSFTLTAQPSKTAERDFIVPLCTDVSQSTYSGNASLNMVIQSGSRAPEFFNVSGGGFAGMPFTAFSEGLAAKSITDINRVAASGSTSARYGSPAFATLYDSKLLPSDWRGLSGLDGLALTSDEWTALAPGAKTAILQWVKLGGVLDLYSKSDSSRLEELGIKVGEVKGTRHDGTASTLGNGMVCEIHWSGAELDGSVARNYSTVLAIKQAEFASALAEREKGSGKAILPRSTPLVTALGEKSFAAWQVGLILFIFGIVVGPVNLFYFARAGRRHRLFFTTPVISVSAAVLLLLVIFFQDGLGGKGHRASIVYLDAAESAAYVHQFQVSRTGVLFGGSFTTEDPSAVNMAVMPNTRWTRLKSSEQMDYYSRAYATEQQRYSVSDKSYGGDWFQSRTEQAHIIDSVQSTRGRIELKPGAGTPVITSTLTAALERLFYVDADGKYWASPGTVTTGGSVTLGPSNSENFDLWRKEAISALPENLRLRVDATTNKGTFYAVSSDPAAGTVATLGSIRWESDRVFLFGPLR
jgi:hypothetical protein